MTKTEQIVDKIKSTKEQKATENAESKWLYMDASGNTTPIDESQMTVMSIEDFIRCEIANDIFGNRESYYIGPDSTRGSVSVKWLLDMYNTESLETGSREYQREKVATLEFKQDMIRTILCRPWSKIPEVHIRVIVDEGLIRYEMVDGQQRIRTCIIGFLKGEFKLPKDFMVGGSDLGGMNAQDVRKKFPHLYETILNYRIANTWYERLSDEMTSDLFVEVLNKTNDMKPQEKRNAVRGFLSSYIRDNSRFETHELFTRIITDVGTKKEKSFLKYFPKLKLNGRMEADEFLSQLLYGVVKGYKSGVGQKSLTDWIKEEQKDGAIYKTEQTWKVAKKDFDTFLDFCLGLVKVINKNNRSRLTKNMAYTMFLYGYELQNSYGKLDKQMYSDWFFDVYTRWSDNGLALYKNHTFPHDKKRGLIQFDALFGGLNKNAIGAQLYVLDLELNKDKDKAGVIELDPRETFSKSDIQKKFFEQGQRCFYTGELLDLSNIAGDHYIARSLGIKRGGVTEYHNLVVTSPQLNNEKDNKTPKEFHNLLVKRGYNISDEFKLLLEESK